MNKIKRLDNLYNNKSIILELKWLILNNINVNIVKIVIIYK